jgi:phosphoribosylglycinamide formyltransferase 1
MKRIAVFASGNGSNAQHLTEFFCKSDIGRVVAIYCNNPKAYVIQRAAAMNIPLVKFDREMFYGEDTILKDLQSRKVDLIVLAGFLWLMPGKILRVYDRRIINIHPALLPLYGGKGMFGSAVHEAVIENGDKESGITIHLIDEMYDRGEVLFQTKCNVDEQDTPESLADKIHKLEHEYYPKVIAGYLHKL